LIRIHDFGWAIFGDGFIQGFLAEAQQSYLKVLGWGWFYLSTILDDYSRYIISWKRWQKLMYYDGDSHGIYVSGTGGGKTNSFSKKFPPKPWGRCKRYHHRKPPLERINL